MTDAATVSILECEKTIRADELVERKSELIGGLIDVRWGKGPRQYGRIIDIALVELETHKFVDVVCSKFYRYYEDRRQWRQIRKREKTITIHLGPGEAEYYARANGMYICYGTAFPPVSGRITRIIPKGEDELLEVFP